MKALRKIMAIFVMSFMTMAVFAQIRVGYENLAKTLEKNKDSNASFICSVNRSEISISRNSVSLPNVVSKKIDIVSKVETEVLKERMDASKMRRFDLTIGVSDFSSKTKVYAITNISGIESVSAYKERIAKEKAELDAKLAKEKAELEAKLAKEAEERRIAEEKAAAERAEAERIRKEKERKDNLTKLPVQIVKPESTNINGSELSWLPEQLQDKFKSNLQEHLGMRTVVDSKSEAALLKIQSESSSETHDEETAIEYGKITTASYVLFSKLRKTNSGYVISIDFTDLTTGEQMSSATSKEYTKSEYLYSSTGAIDELTLALAKKLEIEISQVSETVLSSGSSDFTVEDQLILARQNEAAYRRQQANLDEEIRKLSSSTDINAVQNKKKLEAEKALLQEKQNAEKKRQQELAEQKRRADEDAKLEAERSIALKNQRNQLASDAAKKAAEVRKLKMEKQGVLGQINVIESKKKALVDIRQNVESRCVELFAQKNRDQESEENRIRNKSFSTVEVGSDGKPTEAALKRRENQVTKSYEDLENKFFADCESVKQSTMAQQNALLTEIRADQKSLTTTRTVSSMGDELKVSFGKYEGSKNGWNAYLSLYSDGILIYTDNFIVNYEALSGKKAPNMETELNDAVIEEYTNNVDMYNSLLIRGDPIIYFEIDYNVTAEADDKPSEYKFNFNKIRVINTVSGKVTQNSVLSKVQPRTMKPEQDLRKIVGVVAKEEKFFSELKRYFAKGQSIEESKKSVEIDKKLEALGIFMVQIPNKNYSVMKTEVTQKVYQEVMGENPSKFKGESNPVEMVSWYDCIYFCNKMSEMFGYTPVYSVDENTDVSKWNYRPHNGDSIRGSISQNTNADGFRLPTEEEWEYAAKGGANYTYSGSNNLDEVGWYSRNSGDKTHPVGQKKSNGYGLYDMSGNVWEWCWDVEPDYSSRRYRRGGSYNDGSSYDWYCEVSIRNYYYADDRFNRFGFRVVRCVQ